MYKRKILILICFLVIYILLVFIHSKITNDNLKEVFVLTKDINRGENITLDNTKKVKIDSTSLNIKYVDKVDNLLAKNNLKLGTILSDEIVISSEEYEEIKEDKESILINLSDKINNLNLALEKGSIINIYYTGRSSQLKGLIDKDKYKQIESGSITDSYITVLLLKDVEVKSIYDQSGNNIEGKTESISAINIEVDEPTAILIENIKKYGEFSITVKRWDNF